MCASLVHSEAGRGFWVPGIVATGVLEPSLGAGPWAWCSACAGAARALSSATSSSVAFFLKTDVEFNAFPDRNSRLWLVMSDMMAPILIELRPLERLPSS